MPGSVAGTRTSFLAKHGMRHSPLAALEPGKGFKKYNPGVMQLPVLPFPKVPIRDEDSSDDTNFSAATKIEFSFQNLNSRADLHWTRLGLLGRASGRDGTF